MTNETCLYALEKGLRADGLRIVTAQTGKAGIEPVQHAKSPTPCCSTCGFPTFPGSTCSKSCGGLDSKLPVIVMTTHGTAETAIEAMQRGAFDYLLKPWDLDELTDLVHKALAAGRLSHVPRRDRSATPNVDEPCRPGHRPIAGDAGRFQGNRPHCRAGRDRADSGGERHGQGAGRAGDLRSQPAERTAVSGDQLRGDPRNAPGERTVRARKGCLHRGRSACGSASSSRPIAARCFSTKSATRPPPRRPRFCACSRTASSSASAGNETIHVDVRIIAATSKDLDQAMQQKEFRPDLFFRLNTFTLVLPPLRERADDIPLLAEYFLQRYRSKLTVDVRGISPEALRAAAAIQLAGQRAGAGKRGQVRPRAFDGRHRDPTGFADQRARPSGRGFRWTHPNQTTAIWRTCAPGAQDLAKGTANLSDRFMRPSTAFCWKRFWRRSAATRHGRPKSWVFREIR